MPIEYYYNTKEILEENNDKNEVLPICLWIWGKIFLEQRKECQCCKKIIKTVVFHERDKKKKFENKNKNRNKLSKHTLSELKEIIVTPLIKEEFSFENWFINEKK